MNAYKVYLKNWHNPHIIAAQSCHKYKNVISFARHGITVAMFPVHKVKMVLLVENPEEDKSLGQIAYEAYKQHSLGKSLVNGDDLPPWEALDYKIQSGWQFAGERVFVSRIKNLIPDSQRT